MSVGLVPVAAFTLPESDARACMDTPCPYPTDDLRWVIFKPETDPPLKGPDEIVLCSRHTREFFDRMTL